MLRLLNDNVCVYLQMLQNDCCDKASDVDEVREAAVQVMNKSNRYTSMVEPELTYLNQRWAELTQRLKVREDSHIENYGFN